MNFKKLRKFEGTVQRLPFGPVNEDDKWRTKFNNTSGLDVLRRVGQMTGRSGSRKKNTCCYSEDDIRTERGTGGMW